MAAPFRSTIQALETTGIGGWRLVLACVAALSLAWGVWLGRGTVSVYAVSDRARVEVDQTAYSVAPVVGGTVVTNTLTLGREVHTGEVLVVLESVAERLQLAQERARLQMNEGSLAVARKELVAEREGVNLQAKSALAARDVAQARAAMAKLLDDAAHQQNDIVQRLRNAQLTSGTEALTSMTTAAQQHAAANQARLELQSIVSEQGATLMDREIRGIRLERDVALLEGQISTSRAIIEALEFEISRRSILAPVDGIVADLVPTPRGTLLTPGQKVGAILPPGRVRIVASYVPGEAIGRVRAGRAALVRLDGFPWAQYGTHQATVVQVASEARDNAVRVELHVPDPNPRLPLTHGLTGRVEIEVEQVTPFTMLLRSLGYWISAPPLPALASESPPARASSSTPGAGTERSP